MVLSGRGLLTQEAKGFCERGYSRLLAWAPKPSTARGPTVTLTQTIGGGPANGSADALLAHGALASLHLSMRQELTDHRQTFAEG